jgi:hypothetical protein
LLLQASAKVVMEGEPLFIKCHGWNNLKIYKVIYYKDNTALKYMYENQNITITNATRNDTGTYYCEGRVRRLHYTSENLTITVVNGELVKEKGILHSRGRRRGHMSQCLQLVE